MTRLDVEDLSVTLDGVPVVHGVDLTVAPGSWLAVIGPNGAGKSTLLRAVAGMLPYGGRIMLDGRPLSGLRRRERARLLAYAPQLPLLPGNITALDYALLGRTPYLGYLGREGAGDVAAARRALERMDLAGLGGRRLETLSGGEWQRAVLARVLAQDAGLLLLDEPTTSLDPGHQQQLLELVDRLRRDDGLTVVTTLHDLGMAGQYADEVLLLAGGRAVAYGPPATVLTAESVGTHFGARVHVVAGADGRPLVHLVRPPRI